MKTWISECFEYNTTERFFHADFDRALCAQFAPHEKRLGLSLLSLFDFELAKIRRRTTDPLLRRIKLQFWRDALNEGTGSGYGPAKQLIDCFTPHPPVLKGLEELILSHELFYDQPTSPELVWNEYVGRQHTLFKLTWLFLQSTNPPMNDCFFKQCAKAYGGVKLLCQWHAEPSFLFDARAQRQGQVVMAHKDLIADLKGVSAMARPALLPLALVPPYLRLLKASDNADNKPLDLHPIKKTWVYWRTAKMGFNEQVGAVRIFLSN